MTKLLIDRAVVEQAASALEARCAFDLLRAALAHPHDLLGKQESLGADFAKVLHDNLDSLYEETEHIETAKTWQERMNFQIPRDERYEAMRAEGIELREALRVSQAERDDKRQKLLPLLALVQEVYSIAAHGALLDGDEVNTPTLLWAEGWVRKLGAWPKRGN